MWLSGLAGLLHVPITLLSVEYFGFDGAALSLSLNPWMIFFLYMAYIRLCAREKTARCWSPWSAAALQEWGAQQPPALPPAPCPLPPSVPLSRASEPVFASALLLCLFTLCLPAHVKFGAG
eukprot:COSAG04_NODE_219_length_19842_cov_1164.283695_3_plen_121_part_00